MSKYGMIFLRRLSPYVKEDFVEYCKKHKTTQTKVIEDFLWDLTIDERKKRIGDKYGTHRTPRRKRNTVRQGG